MADLNLPNFEGNGVDAVALTFSGTIADESLQPLRALRLGQAVVLVGVGEIAAVNHKTDKDGNVTRVHTVKMFEAYEVPASQATAILDSVRADAPVTDTSIPVSGGADDVDPDDTAMAS